MSYGDEAWQELQRAIEHRVSAIMAELGQDAGATGPCPDRQALEGKIETFRKAFLGASASSEDLGVRAYIVEEVSHRLRRQLG